MRHYFPMQHSNHYGYPRKMREDNFGANLLSEVSQLSLGHLATSITILPTESRFLTIFSHILEPLITVSSTQISSSRLYVLEMGGILYDSVTWNKCVMINPKGDLFSFSI